MNDERQLELNYLKGKETSRYVKVDEKKRQEMMNKIEGYKDQFEEAPIKISVKEHNTGTIYTSWNETIFSILQLPRTTEYIQETGATRNDQTSRQSLRIICSDWQENRWIKQNMYQLPDIKPDIKQTNCFDDEPAANAALTSLQKLERQVSQYA